MLIARYWERRPAAVAQRIVQLLSIAGGFLSKILWDYFRGTGALNEVARAIELRDIVTSLGPAYIKLGQALSIRPDLLSPAAMRELQKLCDKARPRPGAAPAARMRAVPRARRGGRCRASPTRLRCG